jgi:hypothetical protein
MEQENFLEAYTKELNKLLKGRNIDLDTIKKVSQCKVVDPDNNLLSTLVGKRWKTEELKNMQYFVQTIKLLACCGGICIDNGVPTENGFSQNEVFPRNKYGYLVHGLNVQSTNGSAAIGVFVSKAISIDTLKNPQKPKHNALINFFGPPTIQNMSHKNRIKNSFIIISRHIEFTNKVCLQGHKQYF